MSHYINPFIESKDIFAVLFKSLISLNTSYCCLIITFWDCTILISLSVCELSAIKGLFVVWFAVVIPIVGGVVMLFTVPFAPDMLLAIIAVFPSNLH